MSTRYYQFGPLDPPECYDPIPPGTEPGEECGRPLRYGECLGEMVEDDGDVICDTCGGKADD